MAHSSQEMDIYLNEYNIVVNKITSLSMKFASGSYFIPISLFVGISSLYIDSDSIFTNTIIIILPIILCFYIYNHIRYMILQFKLSGYAKHLELKINEFLEDNLLLWENSISRSNKQNYFEAIFLGLIYILIFALMYYTGYINLSTIIFKNQNFVAISFFIVSIYYFFLTFIMFFLLSYINEHNNTFKKAAFLQKLHIPATTKKRIKFIKYKESLNVKMYILILILLLSPIAFLPLVYLMPNNITVTDKNYDYIIVLGNKPIDNAPSEDMKSRINCLLDYVGVEKKCSIVLSGGNGEAALMNSYLENDNIINYPIILEEASQNTYQNLKNTSTLVSGNVLVITSDYHIFRTRLICNKLKLNYDFLPAKSSTNTFFKSIKECYAIYLEFLLFAKK